jgi:hypothetical protein
LPESRLISAFLAFVRAFAAPQRVANSAPAPRASCSHDLQPRSLGAIHSHPQAFTSGNARSGIPLFQLLRPSIPELGDITLLAFMGS